MTKYSSGRPKLRAGISDQTITELMGVCRQCGPGSFVDLGTGEGMSVEAIMDSVPSTASIWTVENEVKYIHEAIKRFEQDKRNLGNVEFIHAPLEECEIGGNRQKWYEKKALEQITAPIVLLFVDGPLGEIGRYPAVPFFKEKLAAKATILLDDCHRAGERQILEAWKNYLMMKGLSCRSDILSTDRGLGRIFLGGGS